MTGKWDRMALRLSICAAKSEFDFGGGGFREAGAKMCVQFSARRARCSVVERLSKAARKASAVFCREDIVNTIGYPINNLEGGLHKRYVDDTIVDK